MHSWDTDIAMEYPWKSTSVAVFTWTCLDFQLQCSFPCWNSIDTPRTPCNSNITWYGARYVYRYLCAYSMPIHPSIVLLPHLWSRVYIIVKRYIYTYRPVDFPGYFGVAFKTSLETWCRWRLVAFRTFGTIPLAVGLSKVKMVQLAVVTSQCGTSSPCWDFFGDLWFFFLGGGEGKVLKGCNCWGGGREKWEND